MVSMPAFQGSNSSGRAICSICWLTMSRPIVPLSRKLERVAPVNVVFLNSPKSMNGLSLPRSRK